jgi:hypothetical protein
MRKLQFEAAVETITQRLMANSPLAREAAHGKAVRAVAYEASRFDHRKISVSAQQADWEDVQRRIGEAEFRRICGTT